MLFRSVIEQRNDSEYSVLQTFLQKVTGSKGRCPFEYSNVRVVDVIEQHNNSGMFGLQTFLQKVTGSKGRCPNGCSNVRIIDVIEQRDISEHSV